MPILEIIGTIAIAGLLIAILIFESRFIKKNDETLKRHQLILIYLASAILILAGVIGIMAMWGFDFMSMFATLWTDLVAFLTTSVPALIGSAIALGAAMLILRIAKIFFKQIGKKPGSLQRRRKTIAKISMSITKYMVWIVDIIIVLAIWGVDVVPALAGLGIVGLVVGLGAQKLINDLISGFFIVFEQHFDVGDVIEVGGFKGTVIDIGLKTTKVRNWKGEVRMMTNGDVVNVINFSKNPSLAIVEFDIAYAEDIQKTIDLLKVELPKLREAFPEIIEDPSVPGVIKLGESSVTIRAIAKTENEQHYGIERFMRQHIKELLDTNGIEIPFPQVVVHQPKSRG
ncbi:MAG TPA: mechanosensitive ion channel [Bacilli bacterium]|nr:mechanosensitive ion channel [Bacilli bacterium]